MSYSVSLPDKRKRPDEGRFGGDYLMSYKLTIDFGRKKPPGEMPTVEVLRSSIEKSELDLPLPIGVALHPEDGDYAAYFFEIFFPAGSDLAQMKSVCHTVAVSVLKPVPADA